MNVDGAKEGRHAAFGRHGVVRSAEGEFEGVSASEQDLYYGEGQQVAGDGYGTRATGYAYGASQAPASFDDDAFDDTDSVDPFADSANSGEAYYDEVYSGESAYGEGDFTSGRRGSSSPDDTVELVAQPVETAPLDKEAVLAALKEAFASKKSKKGGHARRSAKGFAGFDFLKKDSGEDAAPQGRHAAQGASARGAHSAPAGVAGVDAYDDADAQEDFSYEEPEVDRSGFALMNPFDAFKRSATPQGAHAVPSSTPEKPAKEKKPRKPVTVKLLLKIAASVLGALVAVWAAGVAYFSFCFMPHTFIDGNDVSGMKVSAIRAQLEERAEDYMCSITGNDYYIRVDGEKIGFSADIDGFLKKVIAESGHLLWPLNLQKGNSHDMTGFCSWNKATLDEIMSTYTTTHNEGATPPEDAYVGYSAETGKFEVFPEYIGKTYLVDVVQAEASAAIGKMALTAALSDKALCMPELYVDDQGLIAAAADCNTFMGADFDLIVENDDSWSDPGRVLDHIDGAIVSQWISVVDGKAVFDEAAMEEWCRYYAESHYTYQSNRTYTRPDGVTVTRGGGSYGWRYDRDELCQLLMDAVTNKTTGTVTLPCMQTAYHWVDKNVASDLGDTYVDIDIPTQVVRYIQDGEIVLTAPTVSGDINTGQGTPLGVWYITRKQSPTNLTGVDPDGTPYNVPVVHWMAFINNSHGLHDNPNRYSFGLPWAFRNGGSHGCCNLPFSAAQELYAMIQLGCPVIVHWG